ncbi:EAL domain-containing protein [Azoarcus taiwanensis]|nr:EAL domain-containing protein [Azoarcus taiwanensis]
MAHETLIEELAGIGSWTVDCLTGEMTWSPGLRILLGIGPDVPASAEALLACFAEPGKLAEFARGRGEGGELRLTPVSGSARCLEIVVAPEQNGCKPPTRFIGVCKNVTELSALEDEYQKQGGYLKGILAHLPQGITVFDETLRLKYWNDSAIEVLALPHEIVVPDVRFEDLIMVPATRGEYGPGDPGELVRQRRELALRFEAHSFERTRPNGRTHLVIGEPMFIDGRIAGFITTYTDITERKKIEREIERQNQILASIIENIPCGVSLFDKDFRLLAYNEELKAVLGLPDELFADQSTTLIDFFEYNARRGEYGEGDPDEIVRQLTERARDPQPHSFERVRPDGRVIHIRGQPLPDGSFVTIYNDITELRRAEARQILADKVFENTPEAIVILSPDKRIVSANPAFTTITGQELESVLDKHFDPSDDPSESALADDAWAIVEGGGSFSGETVGVRADGSRYPRALTMVAVRDRDDGSITHFVAIFIDITERKRQEADIAHLAHHDVLTGLANRFSLQARLEQSLADARRKGNALAVLFLDLDRFKNINDSLGHHHGDALLVEVGKRLTEAVRASDTVARLGGDEFVVVVQDVGSVSDAAHVAGQLMGRLSAPYSVGELELHAIPSIGISMFPCDGETPDTLLRNADAAMYHAKALGRANFQFFTEQLNRAVTERFQLEAKLRKAVASEEFELWYQPLFEPQGDVMAVCAVEALLRWRTIDGELVSPGEFIPLAEETGMIVQIGDWVIAEACRQLEKWHAGGLESLRIAINLSARQLRDKGLPLRVEQLMKQHGLGAGAIEFEITESSVMEEPTQAIAVLDALKASGASLSIDDFGTGYSSLSYLKLFPLDRLKIDRSFVSDIEHDANDAAIVGAAVSLAHNLGLRVVAEGVESATQLERLTHLGCDELQGYHLCRPLPAAAVERFLRDNPAP